MKKILLTVLVFFLLVGGNLSLFASSAHAQSTWYNQHPFEWYLKVYDQSVSPAGEIFGERYTAAQVQWIFWSIPTTILNAMLLGNTQVMVCILSGDVASCIDVITTAFEELIKNVEDLIGSTPATGGVANLIGRNQISGIAYTKNLLSKFNPVSEVGAQGFGYKTGASSIQQLWKISRDFSYFLLIIAVIVISFMIMFRTKINPQTIIGIQSALPRIIGAILLITFSYAIAGFMIDLMYVAIALMATLISTSQLSDLNPAKLFVEFTTGENAIGLLFEYWFAFIVTALVSVFRVQWLGGILLLICAIFAIIPLLWYMIKMVILMIRTFAQVVLTIVLGPLEIMLGTVAQNAGFGPWLKKLISYLAVYPVMALLFFLAFFFLAKSLSVGALGTLFDFAKIFPFNPKMDRLAGNSWDPPLTTGAVTGEAILWAIVSYLIITMTPKVMEIIQSFIQRRPFDYASGFAEAAGHARGVWGGTGGAVVGAFQKVSGEALVQSAAIGVAKRMSPTADPNIWQKAPEKMKRIVQRMAPPERP